MVRLQELLQFEATATQSKVVCLRRYDNPWVCNAIYKVYDKFEELGVVGLIVEDFRHYDRVELPAVRLVTGELLPAARDEAVVTAGC